MIDESKFNRPKNFLNAQKTLKKSKNIPMGLGCHARTQILPRCVGSSMEA